MPEKILILKPSSLGDVVQALPVLRLLHGHFPQSRIYWWIDSGLSDLLADDPDLAGVFRFERRRWGALTAWPEVVRHILALRAERFDWVLDLQSLARSGAVAWLANGRLTVGLDDSREGAPGFYDISVRRRSWTTHAVDWYLDVVRRLGVATDRPFEWLPRRANASRAADGWLPPAAGPRIALQPGARWENKRWPSSHFEELVRRLAVARPGAQFVVLGGTEDRPLGDRILAAVPGRGRNLAGQTRLSEVIECLRRCDLVVSNDTGPMHIAAALGVRVVAVFGPTEPRRTGPYGQQHLVLQDRSLACVPCMRPRCTQDKPLACLDALTPQTVAAAVLARLDLPLARSGAPPTVAP